MPLLVAVVPPATVAAVGQDCRPVVTDGDEGVRGPEHLPGTGEVRVDLLFVDFPDAPATTAVEALAAELTHVETALEAASGGRLQVRTGVTGWLRLPREQSAYGMTEPASHDAQWGLVRDAVEVAAATVDLSGTDVAIVVPPVDATGIADTAASTAPDGGGAPTRDGMIHRSVVLGHDTVSAWPAIALHEVGHFFGLPDLYDTRGGDPHRHAGGWGIMGSNPPKAPDPLGWHKFLLGWTAPDDVACIGIGDEVVLAPNRASSGRRLAVVPSSRGVLHVLEYRDGGGVDARACSTGLLAYRVDQHGRSGAGPVAVMGSRPPVGRCRAPDMAARDVGEEVFLEGTGLVARVLARDADGLRLRISSPRPDAEPAPVARVPVVPPPPAPAPPTSTTTTEVQVVVVVPTVAATVTTPTPPGPFGPPPWRRLR